MALGYCEAILLHQKFIASQNYGGLKRTNNGFLTMLYNQTDRPFAEAYQNGHRRDIRVKYKQRVTEAQVQTSANCGVDVVPAYKETTAAVDQFVQIALHVTDDKIRQYCVDASQMVSADGQSLSGVSPFMAEHYDSMLHALNGLYNKMETVLTTSMSTKFGQNVRAGAKTAQTVNFNVNGTTQNFGEGITRVFTDYQINENCGLPMIVGNGFIHGFANQLGANAIGLNQYGVDGASIADKLGWSFFPSQKTATTWGANRFGVFAPNSVHILEDIRNTGSFMMDLGTVKKFTIVDPNNVCWSPVGPVPVRWDVNMEYNTCDTSVSGGYAGSTTVGAGWKITIFKNYGLFTPPTDSFDGADALSGDNGTLYYVATNS